MVQRKKYGHLDALNIKREEQKANELMPPPVPISEEGKERSESDMKMEEEDKRQDIQSENGTSDIKEETEENKSDSMYKRRDDPNRIIFKQFDFKVYNDFKDYPLYPILSKKKLFDDGTGVKVETKEEQSENKEDSRDDRSEDAHSESVDQSKDINNQDNKDESIKDDDEMKADEKDEDSHNGEGEDNEENSENEKEDENEEDEDIGDHEDDDNEGDEENENEDMPAPSNLSESHVDDKYSQGTSEVKEEIRYGKRRFDQVLEDYDALPLDQKRKLTCDEVLGIYLREISQKVNTKFYKILLKFVILFRECCNEYAYQKLIETEKLLADEKIKIDLPLSTISSAHKSQAQQHQKMIIISEIAKKAKEGREEFCSTHTAEYMPEV